MAGKGPPPADNKRRRNKPTDLPAAGHTGAVPDLPKTYRDGTTKSGKARNVTFLKETRDWYAAWGKSPMATQFTLVDWNALQRLAKLVDAFERGAHSLAGEIRLQEGLYGGSPDARRRAGVKIAKNPPGDDSKPADQAAAAAGAGSDARRARLSVVRTPDD